MSTEQNFCNQRQTCSTGVLKGKEVSLDTIPKNKKVLTRGFAQKRKFAKNAKKNSLNVDEEIQFKKQKGWNSEKLSDLNRSDKLNFVPFLLTDGVDIDVNPEQDDLDYNDYQEEDQQSDDGSLADTEPLEDGGLVIQK